MIKIFIAEDVPAGNKGEVAILKGIKECFISVGLIPEISVLSAFYPEIDSIEYKNEFKVVDGVKSLHIPHRLTEKNLLIKIVASIWCLLQHLNFAILYRLLGTKVLSFMRGEIWKEYIETDILIVGHDNLFANPFGSALAFLNSYLVLLAKIIKKPCVILGASVGPYNNKFLELIFKYILNQAEIITLREKRSYEYLKHIGVSKPDILLCADPAVLLKPAPKKRIVEIMQLENISTNGNLVALMASPVMYKYLTYGTDEKQKYAYHIANLARVIDYMTEKLDITVLLMYHATFPRANDDRRIAKDIYKLVKNKDHVKLITNNYSVEELKGLIGECELFIGERTHSLIGAATMYVPCIAISHKNNYKTNGTIEELFGLSKSIVFIENFDLEEFLNILNNHWQRRNIIKESLYKKEKIVKKYAIKNVEVIKKILYLP